MNEDNDLQEAISETLDISKPDFIFKPKEVHDWRQRGPFICCKSCEIEHAVHIGMGKILIGLEKDGTPIFKKR